MGNSVRVCKRLIVTCIFESGVQAFQLLLKSSPFRVAIEQHRDLLFDEFNFFFQLLYAFCHGVLVVLGFDDVGFDVAFDDSEVMQDMGDMVNPVESVNIAHFEVVVGLQDRLLCRPLIKTISVHCGLDLGINFLLVFWGQADECAGGNVEQDDVVWCLW